MRATQIHRTASVWSTFAPDRFLLRKAVIRERLSELFHISLEVQEQDEPLEGEELIGQPMVVRVLSDGTERYFHGMVSEVNDRLDPNQPGIRDLELRPWFWFLRHRVDCRIFQRQTAVDIVVEVLRDAGLPYELQLGEDFQVREYCVQYRESDLDFVSRLLEEEGIRYFFRHEADRHVLVLADQTAVPEPVPGQEWVVYHPKSARSQRGGEHVDSWARVTRATPGAHVLEDFDFKVPRKPLQTVARDPRSHVLGDLEVFDYPGKYTQDVVGQRLSRVRLEEAQREARVYRGRGPIVTLACGHAFSLIGHEQIAPSTQFAIRELETVIRSDDYGTLSGEAVGEPTLTTTFVAAEAALPFRPPRVTRRPRIVGPQTAIVTGPDGEEIHTDQHGRVTVRFHWDRHGERNENSSCWIRVAQPWAGNGWGGLALPRVGQEVVVEFLDGDPDRPIINGRFYNGDMKPPQSLPGSKANMSIRSQSYPGGGGSNEITMNDTAGSELFYLHAQHDKVTEVGNDDHTDVTGFQTLHVGKDQSVAIDLNAQETVGINKKISVGTSLLIEAGTSITLKCGASTIHMNQAGVITIAGSLVTMAGTICANVAAPITNVAGAALLTKSGAVNLTFGSVVRSYGAALANLESGGKAEVLGGSETLIQGGKVKIN